MTPGTSASAWSPDGDLFKAIRAGGATVVTDTVECFTEHGIKLASGAELAADVIVTATGLNLLFLGGMELVVDGREVDLPETMAYKGMMLSGVPNCAFTVGYTNASWTLKADLTSEYVCRLLAHMDAHGYRHQRSRAHRPRRQRGAVARLQLRLRPARARPAPQTGIEAALAAAPELPVRSAGHPSR